MNVIITLKIRTFLISAILLACRFTAMAQPVTASDPPQVFDINTFFYHVGALHGDPESFEHWKSMTDFDLDELSGNHEIWLRIGPPHGSWNAPALLVTAFLNSLDVYLGNTLIYAQAMTPVPDPDFRYYMSHIIPLDGARPDKALFLRSDYPDRTGVGDIFFLAVGESADILDLMITQRDDVYRDSLVDICLGVLLLVIGTGSFFVFLILWKERSYPFFSFGMFSLFAGATYLADANSLFFLNLSPQTHYYLKTVSFLLVPAGLFAFFNTMFTLGPLAAQTVRGLWIVHVLLAFSALILSGFGVDPTEWLLALMIQNCMICIVIICRSSHAATRTIRMVFTGFFLLFILLILIHFLERLSLIPFTFDVFGWGMVGFVFTLGYVMIQHYTTTFYVMQNVSLELEKNRSELLELQKANLLSQLEALKNQVDPHFLFNNFSTLASIIEENQQTAIWFVQELSRVYRYVLQTRSSSLVSLKEELDFLESYRFLMSKRFGDNLSITVSVPETCKACLVMPFSLQLLVENAIKHNIISRKKPLTIRVFVEENDLVVSNRLQKKTVSGPSTRIGLENIRNRYRLITDRTIRISETVSEFSVRLPLIEKKGKNHACPDH